MSTELHNALRAIARNALSKGNEVVACEAMQKLAEMGDHEAAAALAELRGNFVEVRKNLALLEA